jgi:hypothetical protein
LSAASLADSTQQVVNTSPIVVMLAVAAVLVSNQISTPETEIEVYRTILIEPSCSGSGRAPGRTMLVVHRTTEKLREPWWRVGQRVDFSTALQQIFPQASPEEVNAFIEANSLEHDLPEGLIAALGAVALEPATFAELAWWHARLGATHRSTMTASSPVTDGSRTR